MAHDCFIGDYYVDNTGAWIDKFVDNIKSSLSNDDLVKLFPSRYVSISFIVILLAVAPIVVLLYNASQVSFSTFS